MPILRVSIVADKIYAPERDGSFVRSIYDAQRQTGVLLDIDDSSLDLMASALNAYIKARLAAIKVEDPIVLMINGFEFDPVDIVGVTADQRVQSANPHARIFHFDERAIALEHRFHAAGWPRRIGLQPQDGDGGGLAIVIGWDSDHWSHLAAYLNGNLVALGTVHILKCLAAALPGRKFKLLGHSLGTHVVLQTLRIIALQEPALGAAIDKAVLLGGSEFVRQAQITYDALAQTGLAGTIDVYNLGSALDSVVSRISGLATYGPEGEKFMIGCKGLAKGPGLPGWIDVDLSANGLIERIKAEFGLVVAADCPDDLLDHWYYFTLPDNMSFVSKLLRGGPAMSVAALRDFDIPEGIAG